MARIKLCLICWALLAGTPGCDTAASIESETGPGRWPAARPSVTVKRVPLGTAAELVRDDGGPPEWVFVSPDCRHLAYVERHRDAVRLIFDGVVLGEYESVDSLHFSPDSLRVAFQAAVGAGTAIVVDGRPGKVYDRVPAGLNFRRTVFSPDSEHVAYVAIRPNGFGRQFVVCDGKEGRPYSLIYSPSFSPDSQRLAYAARRGKGAVAVVDSVEHDTGQRYGFPVFSPDSKEVVWLASHEDKVQVMVDGRAMQGYDDIREVMFSPNSKRLAYAARRGDKWLVVTDGVEGEEFDECGRLCFSQDSQRLAYRAARGAEMMMVVDGVAGPGFTDVRQPVFSPDSGGLAYVARRREKRIIVVDGTESQPYDPPPSEGDPESRDDRLVFLYQIHFSADSRRVGYAARRGNSEFVVVDRVEGPAYDAIMTCGPLFSPDSKRVAYAARRGDRWHVVVDGVQGPPHRYILGCGSGGIQFTPDSKHYAYVAEGDDAWCVVVDGKEVGSYDKSSSRASGASLVFSPGGKHYAYVVSSTIGPSAVVVDGERIAVDGRMVTGACLAFSGPRSLYGLFRNGSSFYHFEVEIAP